MAFFFDARNVALVEQAAASSSSLEEQAVRLAGLVSVFKLGVGHAAPLAAPSASRQIARACRQLAATPAASGKNSERAAAVAPRLARHLISARFVFADFYRAGPWLRAVTPANSFSMAAGSTGLVR